MARRPGICRRCGGPTKTDLSQLCWSCFTSRSTVEERFRAKVDTSAGFFGCWPWIGARNNKGYGVFNAEGRIVVASRFALELALGRSLELGMEACHHCDNPPCMNPTHLFEGTPRDNAADMVAKGRAFGQVHPELVVRGERNGMAHLTAEVVASIRHRRAEGATYPRLAEEFGIAISHAHRIVTGESWAHTVEGATA